MTHRILVILAVLGLALTMAAGGEATAKEKKKKLKADRGHPTHAFIDSSFAPGEVNRVPIISLDNTTTTADAEARFFTMLTNVLAEKPHYVVLDLGQVAREVAEKGIGDEYEVLVGQWKRGRKLAPSTLKSFASAFGADYVMACEISEWESKEIDWNVEGYSHSVVEARIRLFSPASGKMVVDLQDRVMLKSRLYDPRAHGGGMVDDLGIQRGASGHVVPPAPPIEDAAEKVVVNLVSQLP
jgi:hypothetical protein